MEWQPIETAPVGVYVLIQEPGCSRPEIGIKKPAPPSFHDETEWFWDSGCCGRGLSDKPTHWMPLPEPPQ